MKGVLDIGVEKANLCVLLCGGECETAVMRMFSMHSSRVSAEGFGRYF